MSGDKQTEIEEIEKIIQECDDEAMYASIAHSLYDAGYRKSTNLAEDIFAEIDSIIGLICAMTGLDFIILGKYAELKKKYTEEGK